MFDQTSKAPSGKRKPPTQVAWRKLAFILLSCLFALPLLGMDSAGFQAKASKAPKGSSGNAYDVIAAVNQVRAANGLAAFEVNGALMAAAQAHSEYQASTGSISHTGSGGSDPKARALAAGYGGGVGVSVIENIYGGMNASPQQAVQWWQGDSLHLNTLLSTRHTDVGAGVATSGGVVYYTLDVGSVTGGSSGSGAAASPASANAANPASATTVAFYPVLIATPNPDGSIVHLVQPGQALWTIAAAYQVALPDLLQLNGFTSDTYIFPGNKILIKPATGEDASALATASEPTLPPKTPARVLPAQAIPTRSVAIALPSASAPVLLAATPRTSQDRSPSGGADAIMIIIASLVLGGTTLLIVGNVLKRGGA